MENLNFLSDQIQIDAGQGMNDQSFNYLHAHLITHDPRPFKDDNHDEGTFDAMNFQ